MRINSAEQTRVGNERVELKWVELITIFNTKVISAKVCEALV